MIKNYYNHLNSHICTMPPRMNFGNQDYEFNLQRQEPESEARIMMRITTFMKTMNLLMNIYQQIQVSAILHCANCTMAKFMDPIIILLIVSIL